MLGDEKVEETLRASLACASDSPAHAFGESYIAECDPLTKFCKMRRVLQCCGSFSFREENEYPSGELRALRRYENATRIWLYSSSVLSNVAYTDGQ